MPWAKFDDGMVHKRKVRGLSDASFRLYVSAIIDCCREGSDGLIEGWALRELLPKHHDNHVKQLLERNLLHEQPGCPSEMCLGSQGMPLTADTYVIHDFQQWQLSSNEWQRISAKKTYAAHKRWHSEVAKEDCLHCMNGCTEDARCNACA